MLRSVRQSFLFGLLLMVTWGVAFGEERSSPEESSHASGLVRQALEAEFLADVSQRDKHLAAALAADPLNPQANWLSGRVLLDGKWMSLTEAFRHNQKGNADELYREKREELDGSFQRERQLARWCVNEGQMERAKLHYARLLMNPSAPLELVREAMKQLDLQLYNGQLLNEEEVAAEEKLASEVAQAFKTWQPKLTEWQRVIDGKAASKERVAAAREAIAQITDEDILPVVESRIPEASELLSLELVTLISKFSSHRSTQAMCRAAVFSSHRRVRAAAINELKKRPLHDYVPFLLGALNPYTQSQFQIQHDLNGSVSYFHQVYQQGPVANQVGTFGRTAIAQNFQSKITRPRRVGDMPWLRPTTVSSYENLDDFRFVLAATEAAANTEQQVSQLNAAAKSRNQSVFYALEQTTGQALQQEPTKWWDWWRQYNELDPQRPTYHTNNLQTTSFVKSYLRLEQVMSCFAAGTLVTTESGLRPIESIAIGDRVLSQDPETGELGFKLVLQTTLRQPTEAARISLGDEDIRASLGHPFWVNREGWRMTKELAAGDRLHSISGGRRIHDVAPLVNPIPVHNLVVQGFHTYFVGQQGVLVHDNTYREPTLALVPGLVVAE